MEKVRGHCDRCCEPTTVTTMSRFNQDMICNPCEKKEKEHPQYKEASDAELAECKKGNYNFVGIGLPYDLKNKMNKAAIFFSDPVDRRLEKPQVITLPDLLYEKYRILNELYMMAVEALHINGTHLERMNSFIKLSNGDVPKEHDDINKLIERYEEEFKTEIIQKLNLSVKHNEVCMLDEKITDEEKNNSIVIAILITKL